jgi:AcrR family transcriptional regulator
MRGAKICVTRIFWDNLGTVEHGEHDGPGGGRECLGLRERKKLATREALTVAAIRLALAEGPENVRVTDIAAEVGVSPRTYNNYFSSVPEAICAIAAERALRLGDALRERPADEPLADAIAHAMITVHDSMVFDKDLVRMIQTSAMLRGEFFKTVVAREVALAEAIKERVGAKPGELSPQVLAATYTGAMRVVTQRWLHEDNADFFAMLRETMRLIAPMATAYQAEQAARRAA